MNGQHPFSRKILKTDSTTFPCHTLHNIDKLVSFTLKCIQSFNPRFPHVFVYIHVFVCFHTRYATIKYQSINDASKKTSPFTCQKHNDDDFNTDILCYPTIHIHNSPILNYRLIDFSKIEGLFANIHLRKYPFLFCIVSSCLWFPASQDAVSLLDDTIFLVMIIYRRF